MGVHHTEQAVLNFSPTSCHSDLQEVAVMFAPRACSWDASVKRLRAADCGERNLILVVLVLYLA